MPDKDGKVAFDFTGTPWEPVLVWLAQISHMSLDWQELPGDGLNLVTQSRFTVAQARDMINQHLLTRGYTLLCQGNVLSVAKIKKLDPSMVPRVTPDELSKRQPHEFVKVLFPLRSMTAEIASEEFKPLLSPNGDIVPLTNTNRIEARDAVINLRDIWTLLKEEQVDNTQVRLVREFRLKYARASEVCEQLHTLLTGKEPNAPQARQSPQHQGPSPPPPPPSPPGSEPQQGKKNNNRRNRNRQPNQQQNRPTQISSSDYTLVANQRMNSILAHAQPDVMAIIDAGVKALDVPSDKSQSLLANLQRMQVYRLLGIDPEPVVKTLEEVGDLDPATRLEIDEKNKAIIAYATLADHVIINAIVQKLSGSERSFEVIPLRHLEADYVAGTIEFMMTGSQEKSSEQNNRNYRRRWWMGNQNQTDQKPDQFRVDADVEHNRLLLWANEVEMAEVDNLLVKLGEIPPKGSRRNTMRVIDTNNIKEGKELIEKIRRAWSAPNQLLVQPPVESEKPQSKPSKERTTPSDEADKKVENSPLMNNPFALAQFRQAAEKEERSSERPEKKVDNDNPAPPVKIILAPDGRITISSDDPHALAMFEDLAAQYAGPRKDYQVFRLTYALAYNVALNLEDFFTEEKKSERNVPWWWYDDSDTSTESRASLSKRRPLKFIADTDSNTILVENADATQLKTIEDLIKLYDQPEPADSQSVRRTETFHLEYSNAKVVADTIKEVFRDLLSANDKALQASGRENRGYTVTYSFGNSGEKSAQKKPKFKGMLSLGVDDVSNSLVVSAPVYLFDQVSKIIKELDDAAAPSSTIRVVKLGQGVSGDQARKALSDILGDTTSNRQAQSQDQRNRDRRSSSRNRSGRNRRSNSSD
ncbi:MAG: secretin N-terminal domain-containing protein [Thermoguttaceae bacterium]